MPEWRGGVNDTGEFHPCKEKIGCIETGDNVFIGSNTIVLYDVKIGSNVVIGAGSLVNNDIPDNSVAAGVPCRVIGTFEDLKDKRLKEQGYTGDRSLTSLGISKELEDWFWKDFYERHKD